jgi:hypothetical protein
MLYRGHIAWVGIELTTLVVICIDCLGSHKLNYHTITIKTAPPIRQVNQYDESWLLEKWRQQHVHVSYSFFLSSFGINHLKMIAPRAIVPRVIIQEMFWTFIFTLYILW